MGNRFHVTILSPSPEICKQKLASEMLKASKFAIDAKRQDGCDFFVVIED